MSTLVENPKDRFSRDEAHVIVLAKMMFILRPADSKTESESTIY